MLLKKQYLPGSEWLYFKVFCGGRSSDQILINNLSPIINKLHQNRLIKNWFFIRYNDPDYHLRIRFRVKKISMIGEIIEICNSHFLKLLDQNSIWKIQIDTYSPEYNRYGVQNMYNTEIYFFYESEMILKILKYFYLNNLEDDIWVCSFTLIDQLLSSFSITIKEKEDLLLNLKNNFYKEFAVHRNFKKQLDKKYRKHRQLILEMLLENRYKNEITKIIKSTINENEKTRNEILKLHDGSNHILLNLLGNYIHMMLNRLFCNQQRLHELLVYDFLWRSYRSIGKLS